MSHWCFVLGTRPEIIKCAPIIRLAREHNIPFSIIHTGQHYDFEMDQIFFSELQLPAPDVHLHASGTALDFFSQVFLGLQQEFHTQCPAVVIVQGDTNSAFAGAFVADRCDIPVAHLEAGLRSFDRSMPEEVNRILIDHLATRLYTPTSIQTDYLLKENIDSSAILETGNSVADSVREHLHMSTSLSVPDEIKQYTSSEYALVTLHRPALVDNPSRLDEILHTISAICFDRKLYALFPVHPRTKKSLPQDMEIRYPNLICINPVGYFLMLHLLSQCTFVATDSGGIQEEAAILHVPCITIRDNTERPETIHAGGNIIAGFAPQNIRDAIEKLLAEPIRWRHMYNHDSPSRLIFTDLQHMFPCAY